MTPKTVWQRLSELPPEAQQQVVDFIAFLQSRYRSSRARKTAKRPKLEKEPFIGMWRDREDLEDSSAWVRDLRKSDWVGRR
jgi:hypothetical protein